jgi:SP family general alpha glucoside:H+ symporter-like MFS transporter
MTLWEGIKLHRKAVSWSVIVIVSSSIIMEGYDTTLIGSFYGYPMFQKKYGEYTAASGWQLTTRWMTGIGDIQSVGNLIGAMLNGYFTQKYGHRKVMLVKL